MLLQELWKNKISWDTAVDDSILRRWLSIQDDITNSWQLQIKRQMTEEQDVELHAFSDASIVAIGMAIYICDLKSSNICYAKARVNPIKKLTMPKLELHAATSLAKLVSNVIKAFSQELRFKSIHLWSDSQIVLHWISSKKKLPAFVDRRVQTIHEVLPDHVSWHYLESKENPADMASRGCSLETLKSSEL